MENTTQAAATATKQVNGQVAKVAEPTREALLARIAELEASAANQSKLVIRINEFKKDDKGNVLKGEDGKPVPSGTIAVYGLGRFPVSLYAEQWERLLAEDNVKTILSLAKSPKATRKAR